MLDLSYRQRGKEGGGRGERRVLFCRGLQNKHLWVSHNDQQRVGVACTKLIEKLTCEWVVRDEHVASDGVMSEGVSVTCDDCGDGEWGQEEGHSFQHLLQLVVETENIRNQAVTDTMVMLEKQYYHRSTGLATQKVRAKPC